MGLDELLEVVLGRQHGVEDQADLGGSIHQAPAAHRLSAQPRQQGLVQAIDHQAAKAGFGNHLALAEGAAVGVDVDGGQPGGRRRLPAGAGDAEGVAFAGHGWR